MKNKNQGITLIALIITIIIMLILVAVSISIAINNRLFKTAGKAVKDTKVAGDEEQKIAGGQVNIDGKWYSSMGSYLNGDRADISVGDWVIYNPQGTPYETYYNAESKYTQYTSDQKAYLQKTGWRVLHVYDDGAVDIISEKPLNIGNSLGNNTQLALTGVRWV